MKNRSQLIISILVVVITAITFVLGSLMYFSDLKKTRQNVIGVELADFVYNTQYSMRFGKQIETFYGMDELLRAEKDKFADIGDIYILASDNKVLFATADRPLSSKILSVDPGENESDRSDLYCVYALDDDTRILVRTDQSDILEKTLRYMKETAIEAAIGMAVAIVLIILCSIVIKKQKAATVIVAVIMVVWIVAFGSFVCIAGYRAYKESLNTVYASIRFSIATDLSKLETMGVVDENVSGVDEYLSRYTDAIAEVDAVYKDGDDFVCVASVSNERKVLLNYISQTVLLLTFSLLIFVEYQIYNKNSCSFTPDDGGGSDADGSSPDNAEGSDESAADSLSEKADRIEEVRDGTDAIE